MRLSKLSRQDQAPLGLRGGVRRTVSLFVLCLWLLPSCATTRDAPPSSGGLDRNAVDRLEETARTAPDPAVRAEAYLRLARWHIAHTNPERNYQQALKVFEQYVLLVQGAEIPGEVRDWIDVLKELEREAEETRKAKQRAGHVSKENKELKEALEKLKALDLKMEEKRKQAK